MAALNIWYLHLANQVIDELAKRKTKQFVSFVGDYAPPWINLMFVPNVVSLFVISHVCSAVWVHVKESIPSSLSKSVHCGWMSGPSWSF